ncbi:MAG: four helix bundle protein [Armatimonadota bacterium]|nr:four helix bundle protein [Armatimonadota bacterium]
MEKEKVMSFKDLLVWKQAMGLARDCYLMTRGFPKEELYGMTSQIRRASCSIPANIAEGTGRGSPKDYVQFLKIARGSVRELETHLLLSAQVNLTTAEVIAPILKQTESVAILLGRLIASLAAQKP